MSVAAKRRYRARHLERLREEDKLAQRKYRETEQYKAAQAARMKRFKAKQEILLVETAGRPRPDRCELCLETAATVWDHDHVSGQFRGWLCHRCNRTLGQVKDNAALLRKLADYAAQGGYGYGETFDGV